VLEQSADCIYLFDIETKKILESNTTLKNLLGYTTEEMKSLTVFDFISHSQDDINQQIKLTLKEKKLFIGDRKYIRKDGSLVDVEVSTNIIKHANKKILCVVSRNITERKIKEKELLLNKQAISSSINCLIIADFDGKVQHINNAGVEMFGFTKEKFEGKNITTNFITNQPIILEIINIINKKGIYCGEQKFARKDHSEFYAQITANVIKDNSGKPIALMASLIDISQRKETERE
jgi:PAS domain S-box-containing protein